MNWGACFLSQEERGSMLINWGASIVFSVRKREGQCK